MANSLLALALVVAGAVGHSAWNLLVKRSGTSDPLFVWVYSAVATPVWVAVLVGTGAGRLRGPSWWAGLVSMVLHTVYAVVLQRAYAGEALSVVYPVSRGLAPALVTAVALPWAGAPSRWQVAALPVVLAGAWLASDASAAPGAQRGRGLASGLALAGCTAAYTLWDAYAVASLEVAIPQYLATSSLAQLALLTAVLGSRRREFLPALAHRWRPALSIAILAPASYALVLAAMQLGPPSMIATSRCMNIAIGTAAGAVMLHEPVTWRQAAGIAVITFGALLSAA